MAAKSNALDNGLLALIFTATTLTGLAQNDSSPITTLYVSLHTSTPGAGGSQTTNEAAYTGYARVSTARTSGGWTVTGGSVSPAATISFPVCTGGTETETFVGIGTASSGAGTLLYFAPLSPTISVATSVTPQLTTASQLTEA